MDVTKKEIRKQVKDELQRLSKEVYHERSLKLTNKIQTSPFWKRSTTVALTASRFPEVDTYPLIYAALEQEKQVALPRTNINDRTMQFFSIKSMKDLEMQSFGLMEPIPERCQVVNHSVFDLILVPGVAFTKDGKRLGLGGGFYDRFLPGQRAPLMSVCFHEQLKIDLPIEAHDVKVDLVISDGEQL
ncbi:5-formyltetrahydrofolate cyclo-ligase [Shouchella patagoniensis]|uniref:5-formyltetrahydrofolate cyclo-ligase n=1 Tax=Shouchella patagoniensis TaxID=228576 RepID=UPI0014761FE6|nr:5-formyltetrahydrofolate cyclo-ligase [Shouchella patagoniensis]